MTPLVLLWLDSLIFWPLYIFFGYEQVEFLTIEMMNDFVEVNDIPSRRDSPVQFVEVSLSSGDLDVQQAFLTVLPQPRGITYLMYRFPFFSLAGGIATIFSSLLSTFLFGILVSINSSRLVPFLIITLFTIQLRYFHRNLTTNPENPVVVVT